MANKSKLPICPKWLDPQAQKYWPEVVARLQARGLLADADPSSLIRLCQALAQYRLATIKLNKEGQVITEYHPTYEVEKVHPAFKIQTTLVAQISALLSELGLLNPLTLDPSTLDPSNAPAQTPDSPLDGLADWLARARQGSEN